MGLSPLRCDLRRGQRVGRRVLQAGRPPAAVPRVDGLDAACIRARATTDIRGILHELVRRTGLREAYVAMDCLRGSAPANLRRHPSNARNYLLAFAVPYVWLMPREVIERGAHLIVASTPRIPEVCVNPRAKNFHWADMTRALFEAQDKGADNPVLLDLDGNVTEGPGFNVFAVTDGVVATPDRGVLEGITRLVGDPAVREARAALRGAHRAAGGAAQRR